MRSVLVLLGAYGAVAGNSGACDVDPDANSLLQAKSLVRSRTKLTGVQELLKSVRSVADSLAEGSDASMTPEDVNDAIGTATSALQTMLPSFAEQHALAQHEIADALRTVEACHDQHGGNLMTRLEQAVTTHRGEKEQCDGSLEDATAAEGPACAGQGANPNCLCNEARTAVADQTVLCASVTTMYGMAFCSHHDTCGLLHHCHATEVAIYNALRTDVESAMVSRQEQYRTVRQSECLMELITSAMLSGTPIPHASLTSCDDVSVADLIIHFPNVPANPSPCPSPTGSDPQCAAECAVEVATSTRSHADTSSGASMQLQVDGHWTAAQDFPSNIARGEIVTATTSVSARPSAVRIVAGGSNAWGYTRVSVTCDGESVLVLEGDESYSGSEADIHFWVDGNQAAPEMQEYQILGSGFYRIQQKQGMRYVDAHEGSNNDYDVVSRSRQENPSQWWYLNRVGALANQIYEVQQVGKNNGDVSGRFLDGHERSSHDYRVVTRGEQGNDSQEWHFTLVEPNAFTINHAVNMRFLDAHTSGNDHSLVTRGEQGNDSQKWVLVPLSREETQQARGLMGLS